MTDFMAKMHQIRFRLGLRPRPRWGAYSAPSLLAVFGPTSKGRGGEGGEERGGDRRREESVPIVPVLRNDHCTTCRILRLKCSKFDFGWGSALDPAGGAYSAP